MYPLYQCTIVTITGLDRTYHAHHFIFSFAFQFLFIPCGGLSWLPVSLLLHVKYTLSYRIVSYDTTQLNSTDPVEQRTAKSVVYLFMTSRPTNWVNWVTTFIDRWQLSWIELSCVAINTPLYSALILYRRRRFINHLLTYLLTYLLIGVANQRLHCFIVVGNVVEYFEARDSCNVNGSMCQAEKLTSCECVTVTGHAVAHGPRL